MQIGVSVKNQLRMANSVDPDEMAHYELSHLEIYKRVCVGLLEWKGKNNINQNKIWHKFMARYSRLHKMNTILYCI